MRIESERAGAHVAREIGILFVSASATSPDAVTAKASDVTQAHFLTQSMDIHRSGANTPGQTSLGVKLLDAYEWMHTNASGQRDPYGTSEIASYLPAQHALCP
jgi:hypothetical protein